jgi:hypothetical protein
VRVLVACEFSGIVTKAFREQGHEAYSCDILPTEGSSDWHIQDDVLRHLADGWDMMIAHPPCTYLTVTGNKWFKPEYKDRFPNREEQRQEAIEFFKALALAPVEKIAIENPVGIMSRIWRKPDQIIQPFYFGHSEPKKTCLWLKNLPKLKYTAIVEPDYMVTKSGKRLPRWYASPSFTPERQQMRNRTFRGIAQAMAAQWGNI